MKIQVFGQRDKTEVPGGIPEAQGEHANFTHTVGKKNRTLICKAQGWIGEGLSCNIIKFLRPTTCAG